MDRFVLLAIDSLHVAIFMQKKLSKFLNFFCLDNIFCILKKNFVSLLKIIQYYANAIPTKKQHKDY